MSATHVNIIAYERPGFLVQLLVDLILERKLRQDFDVTVWDDGSKRPAMQIGAELCRRMGWRYNVVQHHGRDGHCALMQTIFNYLQHGPKYSRFIFLPDDVRLCQQFVGRAINNLEWAAGHDPRTVAVNVFRERERDGVVNWVDVEPEDVGFAIRTGWIDGLFIANRKYFEALDWTVHDAPPGWLENPSHSSGLYLQISQRLASLKRQVFCVKKSLVVHVGNHCSVMHPQTRQQQSLQAMNFVDGEDAREKLCRGVR